MAAHRPGNKPRWRLRVLPVVFPQRVTLSVSVKIRRSLAEVRSKMLSYLWALTDENGMSKLEWGQSLPAPPRPCQYGRIDHGVVSLVR